MTMPSFAEWLEKRADFSPDKAYIWASFIERCFELISEAHRILLDPNEWDEFSGGCRRPVPTEPELTSGLGDRVDSSLDGDWTGAYAGISCSYEQAIPGDDRHGIRKRKADFRFVERLPARPALKLYIEAKPLRTGGHLGTRYFAPCGMGCFLTLSPPYGIEKVAAMLSYVIGGRVADWKYEIDRRLPTSSLSPVIRKGDVLLAGVDVVASDHERTNCSERLLTLLHLQLDFTDAPPFSARRP